MSDKSTKLVKNLKKGDMVQTLNGNAKLLCVVKTKKLNGTADLCTLEGGLKISKKHPIIHNG